MATGYDPSRTRSRISAMYICVAGAGEPVNLNASWKHLTLVCSISIRRHKIKSHSDQSLCSGTHTITHNHERRPWILDMYAVCCMPSVHDVFTVERITNHIDGHKDSDITFSAILFWCGRCAVVVFVVLNSVWTSDQRAPSEHNVQLDRHMDGSNVNAERDYKMDANEQNSNGENYYAVCVCSGGAAKSVRQKWGSAHKKKIESDRRTRQKTRKNKSNEIRKSEWASSVNYNWRTHARSSHSSSGSIY